MTKKAREAKAAKRIDPEHDRAVVTAEFEVGGAVGGAITGAAVGSIAGPPGAIAGAVIGAAAGALAGKAINMDNQNTDTASERLDDEIGINGGNMGAPNLKHPPARTGTYSGASSGAGSGPEEAPAEGPMQEPD